MKRMAVSALAGATTLVLFAAAMAIGTSWSPGDPHKVIVVSVVEAQAALAKVLPVGTTLDYEGTSDSPGTRVHDFSGSGVRGSVDVADGHVTMLSLRAPQETGRPTVSSERAVQIARAYLDSIGSPADGLTVTVTGGTGSGAPGWTVAFRRRAGAAYLPDYRLVELDSIRGQVFGLVDVRRPYDPPGEPRVSAADAAAAAVRTVGSGTGLAPLLVVTFDATGRQLLVWMVPTQRQPSEAGVVVTVDAGTGDVVDLAQP